MSDALRNARRDNILQVHGWRYTHKGQVGDPCTYCGVVSDTMDHVPPIHYTARMADLGEEVGNLRLVPACRDCNLCLGGSLFLTIESRRAHIKRRLRARYKKVLRIPGWDEDDLAGLSPEMARDVMAHLRLREGVMARLSWAR
jgi:5-methylcytosine-specific restriction endonuclease McrA